MFFLKSHILKSRLGGSQCAFFEFTPGSPGACFVEFMPVGRGVFSFEITPGGPSVFFYYITPGDFKKHTHTHMDPPGVISKPKRIHLDPPGGISEKEKHLDPAGVISKKTPERPRCDFKKDKKQKLDPPRRDFKIYNSKRVSVRENRDPLAALTTHLRDCHLEVRPMFSQALRR